MIFFYHFLHIFLLFSSYFLRVFPSTCTLYILLIINTILSDPIRSDPIRSDLTGIRTSDGGSHLDGLKTAVTRTINTAARKVRDFCVCGALYSTVCYVMSCVSLFVLFHSTQCCAVLHCTVLHCTVLYCTLLCFALRSSHTCPAFH